MKQTPRPPFLLESGLNWLAAKANAYRIPLLASFLFGMLAYGFTFTNKLVNHDEVFYLFSKGGSLILGRWGLKFLELIFPNVSMPWIYGLVSIALIGTSVCLICRIFQIQSKLMQIVLAGSIVVFPSLTSTFAYMFTSSSYAVSFLLAVLAVYLIQSHTKCSLLPALGCMVFSIGIYQSYVSISASLLVILLIQHLLLGNDTVDVLKKGIFYLAFLIVSLVSYYLITKLCFLLVGSDFGAYADKNTAFQLSDIPRRLTLAYQYFFYFLFNRANWLIPTAFGQRMNQVLLVISALLLLWILVKRRQSLAQLLLMSVLLILIPPAIDCMYLFTTEDAVHTLVMYGFTSFYVLAVVIADLCIPISSSGRISALLKRAALEAVALTLALSTVSNIYTANTASLNQYLRYENTYAFYTALIADLQQMPEFNEHTKLAIVGDYQDPDFYDDHLIEVRSLTGINGFLPGDYSKDRFMEYYMGFPISFAVWDEIQPFVESPEFEEMPVYPYYGSMRFFGDILVVKLC